MKFWLAIGGAVFALLFPIPASADIPYAAKVNAINGSLAFADAVREGVNDEPRHVPAEGDPLHTVAYVIVEGRVGHCPLINVGVWACRLRAIYWRNEFSGPYEYRGPHKRCKATMVVSRRWGRFPAHLFDCPEGFRP